MTRKENNVLLINILIQLVLCTKGMSQQNVLSNLTDYLMDRYGRGYARPVFNKSTVTYVHCQITFSELHELNTRQEFITISAFLEMTWADEYLRWNPLDFDQVTQIILPSTRLWRPDITLLENVDADFVGLKPDTNSIVESNGRVTLRSPGIFRSSCKQRVKYFPFDSQLCEFRFASFSFGHDEIDLSTDRQHHTYSCISCLENIEWESRTYSVTKEIANRTGFEAQFSTLTYRILFTRRYNFHLLYLIVPGTLLSMVSPMVFYLPPISKQKLTFAVTNMLAFVVFQQLVTGSIPFRSDSRPILGIYLEFMIIIACVAVAATALQIRVAFGDGRVSQWIERLFLDTFARFACQKWLRSKYRRRSSLTEKVYPYGQPPPEESLELIDTEGNQVKSSEGTSNCQDQDTTCESASERNKCKPRNESAKDSSDGEDRIKMLLKRVTSILDVFIFRHTTLDSEDQEREIRLSMCIVVDRFMFYVFSVTVLVVTGCSLLYLIIGSIHDFNYLKDAI